MTGNTSNSSIYNKYRQTSINTASPAKLLLMLYDGAIKFLHQAEKAITENNISEANTYLIKVQDIIIELMSSLDMDKGGEVAQNLYKLYEFYLDETRKSNIKKDLTHLHHVLEFFELFRGTWAEAAQKTIMEFAK